MLGCTTKVSLFDSKLRPKYGNASVGWKEVRRENLDEDLMKGASLCGKQKATEY
jgi:hypothetical protein